MLIVWFLVLVCILLLGECSELKCELYGNPIGFWFAPAMVTEPLSVRKAQATEGAKVNLFDDLPYEGPGLQEVRCWPFFERC